MYVTVLPVFFRVSSSTSVSLSDSMKTFLLGRSMSNLTSVDMGGGETRLGQMHMFRINCITYTVTLIAALLPSGQRYRVLSTKTRATFPPYAIALMNSYLPPVDRLLFATVNSLLLFYYLYILLPPVQCITLTAQHHDMSILS